MTPFMTRVVHARTDREGRLSVHVRADKGSREQAVMGLEARVTQHFVTILVKKNVTTPFKRRLMQKLRFAAFFGVSTPFHIFCVYMYHEPIIEIVQYDKPY